MLNRLFQKSVWYGFGTYIASQKNIKTIHTDFVLTRWLHNFNGIWDGYQSGGLRWEGQQVCLTKTVFQQKEEAFALNFNHQKYFVDCKIVK